MINVHWLHQAQTGNHKDKNENNISQENHFQIYTKQILIWRSFFSQIFNTSAKHDLQTCDVQGKLYFEQQLAMSMRLHDF